MVRASDKPEVTPKQLAALRWFEHYGPVALFGWDAPSPITRRHLLARGLTQQVKGTKTMQFIKYELSQLGRDVLARNRG